MSLKSDIGEEEFDEVVILFVAEIGEKIESLLSNPADATADDFHFLKGSAANLGFVAMSAACDEAEEACRSGSSGNIAAVASAFDAALDEAKARLPVLASD